MRKISLFAGVVALALGATAVSSSAFAACLTSQEQLTPMSLTHDDMVPNAGFGYNKDAYNAALAKGNACPVTQQAQPVSDTQPVAHARARTQASYN